MDYKIFKKLEAICKKEWRELAESGSDDKSHRVDKFVHGCPACDISTKARMVNSKQYKNLDDQDRQHCCLCPIDIWREVALKAKRQHKKIPIAACQNKDSDLYSVWFYTWNYIERKLAAKAISMLSWSYLPEYDKIDNKAYKGKL